MLPSSPPPPTPGALLDFLLPQLHASGFLARLAQPGVVEQKKLTAPGVAVSAIHSALTDIDLFLQESIEFSVTPWGANVIVIGEEDTPYGRRHNIADVAEPCLRLSVDPIDGTHAYAIGRQDYCTAISCFDETHLYWGAIHFPGLRRLIMASVAAHPCELAPSGPEGLDPYLQNPYTWRRLERPTRTANRHVAAHYRLLLEPFVPAATSLVQNGYTFCTLDGDARVEWCAPAKCGSNGALLNEVLRGSACAYVAPFTAFHDVAPLVSFFPPEATRFYAADESPGRWQPIPATDVLRRATKTQGLRCRVIMATSANFLDDLERCLSGRH